MAEKGTGVGGALAVLAVVACCAFPAILVSAVGGFAAMAGVAARYWPLTAVGAAALLWGGVKLGRLVAARNRALRDRRVDYH